MVDVEQGGFDFERAPEKDRDPEFLDAAPIYSAKDPDTSRIAGEVLTRSGRRWSMKMRILKAMRNSDGWTSAELAHNHRLDRHMVARRLPDMEVDGLVYKGAARKCSTTGSRSVTWLVSPFGRQVALRKFP